MTDLLDNALVRKYFGCNCPPFTNIMSGYHKENCGDKGMALRILTAMEEPIKKGERCLELGSDGHVEELTAIHDRCRPEEGGTFHAYQLRLPDRFQPKPAEECDHHAAKCQTCDTYFFCECRRKPPAAPERECPMVMKCLHGMPTCPSCKPPPPTERCGCNNPHKGPCDLMTKSFLPEPDQAVEEKITSIVSAYSPNNSFRPALRASLVNLVLLARGGKA